MTRPTPPCLTLVTVQDIRAARYCLPGVRPWFRRHGLDWQAFLDTGISAETLRATGDALVEPVIRMAEERASLAPTAADGALAKARETAAVTHGR